MVYQGTVQNGQVVFQSGIQLPEGAVVKVELLSQPPDSKKPTDGISQLDPVFLMGELAEDAGIPDLSVNINHYLYGHPKVTDAE